ncbi:MAG: helix-turn-helix domain-containing protein [Dehalococcoidia bacterium]
MTTTRELAQERLRVQEAAERLGVSRSSVYRYVREGRLTASRDEQGLVFTGLDVEILEGYRSFGRRGPRLYGDKELTEFLAEDQVELPSELRHLLTA